MVHDRMGTQKPNFRRFYSQTVPHRPTSIFILSCSKKYFSTRETHFASKSLQIQGFSKLDLYLWISRIPVWKSFWMEI